MSKNQSINPAAAAIAGLALGAAAGAAATVLSDKNNRQKIGAKLDHINQQTQDAYGKASKKLDQALKTAEPKVKESLNKLKSSGATNTNTAEAPRKRAGNRTRTTTVAEEAGEQIDELATKGGEVIHHNLPEK